MSDVVSFDDHKARKYLERGLILYHGDPADNDYQAGFRDALALTYAEALGHSSTDDRIAAVLRLAGVKPHE